MTQITAKFVFNEDVVYETAIPAEGEAACGKLSDSVAAFRQQAGAFLTTFLAAHDQPADDVDVLEETVEDDEEDAGKSKGQKKQGRRQKRKR
mmetsp:Transcript_1773/g.5153  ORF Transcript_1773/g.5153 Transcript_1773/m.5153 type:complete len:92 (+) Transcript_1773:321-596(+)